MSNSTIALIKILKTAGIQRHTVYTELKQRQQQPT